MSYVTDGTLTTLSNRAVRMLSVAQDVRAFWDNDRCKKNQFFHSIDKLAELAGLSRPHAVYALKELEEKGIIIREHRHSHSTLYTYVENSDVKVTKSNHQTVTKSNHQKVTLRNHRTTVPERSYLTTTWLDDQLRDKLISYYGEQAVNDRVVVIASLNGKIKNKTGLLVDSLKRGYMPASKELQEKEEKKRHEKAIQDHIDRDQQERDKMIQDYNDSEATVDLIALIEESFKDKEVN